MMLKARLEEALDRRQTEGTLRSLKSLEELKQQWRPDFSSNDYLGLAQCRRQQARVQAAYASGHHALGATGSRLLSGDSVYCRQLEDDLARLHNRPSALVCNSGYDANLCVTSCLPVDVVVMDELCHNSLVFGARWNSRQHDTVVATFAHNDVEHLKRLLQQYHGKTILVLVESVYSMDGDVAPLKQILNASQEYGALVVVDEAHGLGIYGRTNRGDLPRECQNAIDDTTPTRSFGGTGVLAALELEHHPALLCSVHTFGKAAGCHGAVICSDELLRDYLLNYARPFIYSTALPLHSLVTIRCAYETMTTCDDRRQHVFALVKLFRRHILKLLARDSCGRVSLYPSESPIQALLVPGNDSCIEFCQIMCRKFNILLYPIRAPTVPRGQERVRIILHAHNTALEVDSLVECIQETLCEMGLLQVSRL